jgi:hypothetical protein
MAWSELRINAELKVRAFFRASISVHLGNGQKTLFWSDPWIQGQPIEHLAPILFSCIPTRLVNYRTVAQGLHDKQWVNDIRGGLFI